MSHAKGYVPSTVESLSRFKHVHHLFGSSEVVSFPPSATTSQCAPDVMDQGQTSSCGGHGTSCGVTTALAFAGTPLPFVASPKGIYDDARVAGGGPLEDGGIDPATLLQSLSSNGVRAIQAPTPDGRYSDCDPATINVPETDAQNSAASQDLLVGEYALDPRDIAFPGLVAACVSRGVPVGVGIVADGPFEAWGESWSAGKAPLDGIADFNQADHWVVVLDYRTAADGSLVFKIRNSWSKRWGDSGNIEVTANWLQSSCMEAIAFAVGLKS